MTDKLIAELRKIFLPPLVGAAAALSRSHPYALDYIKQAPVLVLFASGGRFSKNRIEVGVKEFAALCGRGVKLREIMDHYGASYPLRAIHGSALRQVRWSTICGLNGIKPSSLAQCIPASGQYAWLFRLDEWLENWRAANQQYDVDLLKIENFFEHCHLEWAANNLVASRGDHQYMRTLVDYMINQPFNPRWSLERLMKEANDWHMRIGRTEVDRAAFTRRYGISPETALDQTPFPLLSRIGGYEFRLLRTGTDFREEGIVMHHCVETYFPMAKNGIQRIYSMAMGDKRIATISFGLTRSLFGVEQVQGPCNGPLEPGARDVAAGFCRAMGLWAQGFPIVNRQGYGLGWLKWDCVPESLVAIQKRHGLIVDPPFSFAVHLVPRQRVLEGARYLEQTATAVAARSVVVHPRIMRSELLKNDTVVGYAETESGLQASVGDFNSIINIGPPDADPNEQIDLTAIPPWSAL